VFVKAKEDNQLQIIAKSIVTNKNIIEANGDVLVFSPHYYITAKKAIYNKTNQTLKLYENVNISKNNEAISVSNYASIDMKNELNIATPVLLLDKKSDIWIDAKKIQKHKDINQIQNATLSSCDCYNPAWSLGFAKGDFNTKTQWVNTYNNTLYIKDIPAWYFLIPLYPYVLPEHLFISYLLVNPPYIGFSTSNQRESGLLRPNIGYSSSQGYLYEQPIYYAPSLNYDFEFIPKIRTKRGSGTEIKYRYKDSISSQLNISYGDFRERKEYFLKEKLINQIHYGWQIDYKRDKLLANNHSTDGLIISLQDMNDIEYKNTKYNVKTTSSNRILESKIEYFYNTEQYYTDIHIQSYNDISLPNNDTVFQTLPKTQLHKYTSNFLNFKNISSSFDFKFHRKIRQVGIGANSSEILLPLNYNSYYLNNYLNINFIEQFKIKHFDYINDDNYKNGYTISNNHIVNISSDLLKSYDNVVHTIQPSLTFNKYNKILTKGLLYGINTKDTNLAPFETENSNDQITLSLNQSFYDKKDRYNINHQLTQSFFDNNNTLEKGNLENELKLSLKDASISNRTHFNHNDNLIIKSTYAFDYKFDEFSSNIDYSFSKDKNATTKSYKNMPANKSITLKLSTKVFKYYKLKYKRQYDIINDSINNEEFGINIDKKCWQFDLKLSDNLIASATNDKKARRQNTIYATITLKPLISIAQTYVQDEREE
jgi:LPS-assembly protein